MNKRISIISLVFLLLAVKITAQVYPVSTTTTVSTPYPTSLSGFVDDLSNKVTLTINVRDVTLSGYPVKLRMVLKSNSVTISTSDSYIQDPYYINGGEALVLTSSDLENYFRTDNLNFSGYSKNQYLNSGQLPDGVYQLSFQVIDYAKDVNISSAISAFLYIYVNDPPSLNLPLNKTTIEYTGSQSIAFNWSFLHSPYSRPGFSPSYTFELWEVYPSSLNPDQVVLSTEPVYTEELTGTSLNYTILNPLLTAGYKYAWRVQVTDPDEITEFKEDGYSDVYWFQYGVTCDPPELSVESVGADHINVEWETEQAQTDYTVRYRPTDQEEVTWYSTTTNYLSQDIESLRSSTEYIIQVQGQCGTQESGYSESVTATTKMDLDYQCGETDDEIDIENEDLLTELAKGTHITAGDFDVEIYSVEGNNGVFDGKGYILVPLFNFIKLEADLNSISVNTDYQLVSGNIKSVYNIENSLTINISGSNSSSDDSDEETNDFVDIADEVVSISDSVTSVTVSGDKVIVTTSGNTTAVAVDSGKVVAITTSDGDQYVVDGTTNTVYTSSSPSGSAPASNTSSLEKESSPTYEVSYEANADQSYGFDAPSSEKPTGYFNYQTGSETLKAWKSIEAGKFDKLNAVIEGEPVDSLYFSRESLSMVMESSTMEDGTKQLLITGQSDEDTDELYAWYEKQENDSSDAENYYAGSVDLISYEKESLDLCLVSVNGSVVPNAGYVQTYLNSIYKQGVVEWNVTKFEGGVTVELSQSDQTVIDNTDDDDNMDYTSDMKLAIKALKKLDAYDGNTVYLFMADGATDESIAGYMPLKGQFGFIFKFQSYPDEYLHTIAHEVAHGPFRLRHTFSDENDYPQTRATTNNLLDYSGSDATDLYKYQWDLIHDPESIVFASLEDEEEGESSLLNSKFSNVYLDTENLIHENNYYFILEFDTTLNFFSMKTVDDTEEAIKVNWNYEAAEIKQVDNISLDVNTETFGSDSLITLKVTDDVIFGSDSSQIFYLNLMDISFEEEIVNTLLIIIDAEERFNELKQLIISYVTDNNYYPLLIQGDNDIYINKGMNKYVKDISSSPETDLEKYFSELYEIDKIIQNEGYTDKIIEKANELLEATEDGYLLKDTEFKTRIIQLFEKGSEESIKEDIENDYKTQIHELVFEELKK